MSKNQLIKEKYQEARETFGKEFKRTNSMSLPTLSKITINMGTGTELRDKGVAEKIIHEFTNITGQKPKVQAARLSIAGFGIREGMPVGLTSTLRGPRMFDFFEKLVTITLPRLRDFRGVSGRSFDARGNYTLGMSEHTVFPEIDLAKVDKVRGLEMTFVIKNAGSPEAGKRFLELLGMPFEKA